MLNSKGFNMKAALLKSELMTAIGNLFSQVQDNEQEVNLKVAGETFWIADMEEEVQEVYLGQDGPDLKVLKVGSQAKRSLEIHDYDVERYFGIPELIALLSALENIRDKRKLASN